MWNLTLAELVHRIEARFPEVPPTKAAGRGPSETETSFPRNATSDFEASADITSQKKVRRLAAVCSIFVSTAFQCLLPD